MTKRTRILRDLVEAAQQLDDLRESLTRAYVLLDDRHGVEANEVRDAVADVRDIVFDGPLAEQLEKAITLAGRMP